MSPALSTPAPRERPKTPQALFDRVAPYYDTLNAVLSFGLDRRWRRQATAALGLRPGAHVLDVATGTGALAAEIVRGTSGTVTVTACDVNERMLDVARRRIRRAPGAIDLVRCDAAELPFRAASFDAVTIAFAIDDMPDRDACAREIARVLRPGGKVALLELGQPDAPAVQSAYRAYLRTFRLVSRLSAAHRGYAHLEQEILAYRGADAVGSLLTRSGFTGYTCTSLTWGIARLHVATRGEVPQP